jgi:hypothetical protein
VGVKLRVYDRVYILLALARRRQNSPPNDREVVELQPQGGAVIAR